MNINDLMYDIAAINSLNGWREEPLPSKMEGLMLITTEVAEAAEAIRNADPDNLAEELADVIIRSLDFCEIHGINIKDAIEAKLEKNRGRGYRHGNKVI